MEETTKPGNREETGRNPDGTFKEGFSGNPSGRPRNPLKEFSLKEFNAWTDEQKKDFLEKISPIDRWKMTEGNPVTDVTSGGDKLPQPILNVYPNNSNKQDNADDQEDKVCPGGNSSE